MKYDVSIVIVCMNNYGQLADCLDSIRKYTTEVTYETLLVAYFFSADNLAKLRAEYPWVTIIESNEIRGFSANNNLALRQAQGEYCFVVNDDTYMTMPVIDRLYADAKARPEATIISPQIVRRDGSIQYSGKGPISAGSFLKALYKISNDYAYDPNSKWCSPSGLFRSYNILGAAFLIKTEEFKKLGFFDEYFFYGPEDIALGNLVNETGGEVWVDADVKITHLVGGTGGKTSKTVCATRPANRKGEAIYHSRGSKMRQLALEPLIFLNSAMLIPLYLAKGMAGSKDAKLLAQANFNVCRSIFSNKSTTEIFKRFYNK